MAEYISKESAISIFRSKEEMAVCTPAQPYFVRAAKMLELLPAADVAPVRRGRWEYEHETWGRLQCSNCKKEALLEKSNGDVGTILLYVTSNYCPNCGAKMEDADA